MMCSKGMPFLQMQGAYHLAVANRTPPIPSITMISASQRGRGPLRLPGLLFIATVAACLAAGCNDKAELSQ